MSSPSPPLELYFLPYLSPGHMIPLFEMARLFAARGEHVTVITTPSNATLLQNSVDRDTAAGHHIGVHVVPLRSKEVGLPDGLENFAAITDIDTARKLYYAMTLLQQDIEQFLSTRHPDCIISDKFYPWTTDFAARLGFPRIVFQAVCMFAQSIQDAIRRPDSPHLKAESDHEPFLIPGLPDPIVMKRSEIPGHKGYAQLMEQWREAELKSYGVLLNGFYEMDSAYTEHYRKIMGHKIFHVGPTALIHHNAIEKVERGQNAVVSEQDCLSWLNSKKPNSVLYVCFGSLCRFPDAQLMELACGLEASGHQFIWALLGKEEDEKEEDKDKWLPNGFDEKIKGRGMIIKGWAPQMLILEHPSVGGFLTHCGGNSMIEAMTTGVPMITWPLYAEHFYDEKLVTQVLGIGVEVGVEDWNLCFDAGKNKSIDRGAIEKAVRRLMDGGDEVMEMRRKVKKLGEKAKGAVEEGGSSHRNLTLLIEELKQLRDQKASA